MPDQTIYDIAQLCHEKGIDHVVHSPGSRNAPLTIAFARHPGIKVYTLSDERSAAFVALGLAEETHKTVVLICTSGSALLNYYPAITEAYYRGISLLVLSADRPPELIDKWDGQTIRQNEVFKNHIIESHTFPVDLKNEHNRHSAFQILNRAINLSDSKPGPVHINIPLREPLYPNASEKIKYSENLKVFKNPKSVVSFQSASLKKEINSFSRILIIVGQMKKNYQLSELLKQITQDKEAIIIADHTANLYPKEEFINTHEIFLNEKNGSSLPEPDLLISLGRSVLSKNLKQYLRSIENLSHWQIGPYEAHDTYNKLRKTVQIPELEFISLTQSFYESDFEFIKSWRSAEKLCRKYVSEFSFDGFSELKVVKRVIEDLPENVVLHSANSLSTRYVNLFHGALKESVVSYTNRGTSGIDGSSSTAVGHSLVSDKLNVLITGDLAFFYDRNAFWHNYNLKNLRIILLNNHGGGIFRVINGPSEQEEFEEFFDTQQVLEAKNTAQDFKMDYIKVEKEKEFDKALVDFFKPGEKCKIIEVQCSKESNDHNFKKIYSQFGL